jgi:hypothetical protein
MYQSFLVRIWRDDGQATDGVLISAESIQTGQSYQFKTVSALLNFIAAQIDVMQSIAGDSVQQRDDRDCS